MTSFCRLGALAALAALTIVLAGCSSSGAAVTNDETVEPTTSVGVDNAALLRAIELRDSDLTTFQSLGATACRNLRAAGVTFDVLMPKPSGSNLDLLISYYYTLLAVQESCPELEQGEA